MSAEFSTTPNQLGKSLLPPFFPDLSVGFLPCYLAQIKARKNSTTGGKKNGNMQWRLNYYNQK